MIKRLLLCLVLIVFGVCKASAASFTSAQTGNYNDGATWGNSSPGIAGTDYPNPTGGDTVTISLGHTVTITSDVTVGTDPGTDTTELEITGTLIIGDNVNVTLEGQVNFENPDIDNPATITIGAGSSFMVGGTYDYRINFDTYAELNINGTEANRATFGAAVGRKTNLRPAYQDTINITATYTDFVRLSRDNDAIGNLAKGSWQFTNCLFLNCGEISFGSNPVLKFVNCDFREPTTRQFYSNVGYNFSEGQHEFNGCTFSSSDGYIAIRYQNTSNTYPFKITNCVFNGMSLQIYTDSVINGSASRLTYNDDANYFLGTADAVISDSVFLGDCVNAHVFEIQGTGEITVDNCVSEVRGDGDGNHYAQDSGAAGQDFTMSSTILINDNPVVTRAGDGTDTITLQNCTAIDQVGATNDGISAVNPFLVNEGAYNGDITLKNNIWVPASGGVLTWGESDLDHADHTDMFGGNYSGRYYNTTFSGDATGTGTNDISIDPQFANANANLMTFDTSVGGPGTYSNLFEQLLKRNGFDKDGASATFDQDYNVPDIHSYIFSAFAPTNAAIATAADDGGVIGAVAYQSATTTAIQRVFWW